MLEIIIIDDEPKSIADLKRIILNIYPSSIIHSFDVPESALAHLLQNKPDIAFLDIEMPTITGLEFAKRVKIASPKTNIIFVTAYSKYAIDAMGLYPSGYLMKPISQTKLNEALDNLRFPLSKSSERIRVQCFGNFEVFVDGVPVKFARSKTKELFAYLIDRGGARVTMSEITSVLWEDAENTPKSNSFLRQLISDLISTLNNLKLNDIIIKSHNQISVDLEKINCDYYSFLKGDATNNNAFRGEYMSQYSWSEHTTGYLFHKDE